MDTKLILPPEKWNATRIAYNADLPLHFLIAQQAARTPNSPALFFDGMAISHNELENRAGILARRLQKLGICPGTLVGVSLFRSFEMVIALLGILKAGGAYVPIDPEYPFERIGYMLEDSGVTVLVTNSEIARKLPIHQAKTIFIEEKFASDTDALAGPLFDDVKPNDLAYMIYTSGSTGRPKGALNHHSGVCNRLLWMQRQYGIGPQDTFLQKTPFSFDVSVWEFFLPLLTGSSLVIARPGGHHDPSYLAQVIREYNISVIHFVPSMLRAFLADPTVRDLKSLRHVICSGEALTFDLQQEFFRKFDCNLHNLYGPTEAAVDVTHWTCERDSTLQVVPIGFPVANTQIRILDEKLQTVPVGMMGELYIGGIQVGLGYHNRPELTAEKFLPDPFSIDSSAKLYRSGDLARWNAGGAIEYLGRIDHQVKIRGNRIELGEIESVLGTHPDIHQAVVVAYEKSNELELVAYLATKTGKRATVTDLRRHLMVILPEYMVPGRFVWLQEIPLSPNGKVDRHSLPLPASDRPDLVQSYVKPSTMIEERIVQLWEDAIGVFPVGIDDHFFELGGDSLSLLGVHEKLQRLVDREIPITVLFEQTTVRSLARYLSLAAVHGAVDKAPVERARLQRQALALRRSQHQRKK